MKEKVEKKLQDVSKSINAAKNYGVDVREELRVYADLSIDFTRTQYGRLSEGEKQSRYGTIFNGLINLENIILDKRKLYQVRETLIGTFDSIKKDFNSFSFDDFLDIVKKQLVIYSSSKIPEIYRPERIINDIFSFVYEAIKMEIAFKGNSVIFDELKKDEASLVRINSFLSKDMGILNKLLGSDNEKLVDINNYVVNSKNNDNNYLLDEGLLNKVVNTIKSDEVKNSVNFNTTKIKSELDLSLSEITKKREEYVGLVGLQNKARKLVSDLKHRIDKRVAPIVLSLVIMSGVGLGTYNVVSNMADNVSDVNITQVDSKDNTRQLNAIVRSEDNKDYTPLMVAGASVLASSLVPKLGFAFQGAKYLEDRKKYNQDIRTIVERKHQMESLKEVLAQMVEKNNGYSKQADKQKNSMMWASINLGVTEEQEELLSHIYNALKINGTILDGMDDVLDETIEDSCSRRLGC